MSKGGQQRTTTTVEIPRELREAAERNLQLAGQIGAIGPTMFDGPSVAGFSPQQMAAMQGTDQAASMFGMPSAVDWQQGAGGSMQAPRGMSGGRMHQALTGMAAPTETANGVTGYNTMDGFRQALARMPAAQRAAIEGLSMNPHTGAAPTNPVMARIYGQGRGNTPVTPIRRASDLLRGSGRGSFQSGR